MRESERFNVVPGLNLSGALGTFSLSLLVVSVKRFGFRGKRYRVLG